MSWLAAAAVVSMAVPSGAAAQSPEHHPPPVLQGFEYRMVGPTRGGRVTAVAGHGALPGTYYMGATGGGVWKTTDYGQHWSNVSDGYFATGSIGAIQVAPSDSLIVYVGTGSDGIRSNVIVGRGVYRSDDGGESWEHIGLPRAGQIGAVLIHPQDPERVFVAAIGQLFGPNAERGVYRSVDGGDSWQRVLHVSDSTGAVDLEFAPDDPATVYASLWRAQRTPWTIISGAREGGVYRSTDGGTTWDKLGGGLPDGLVGKSDLAVSPADPNRLYVLIEAEPGGGLYRSDDRGDQFRLVSTQSGILNRPFYYTNVDADPQDADVVYVGNESFFKSVDGGATFVRMRTPHGDNHDLWIDPHDSDLFIQSNDGGANVTRDGGRTWSTQFNQPTAELYSVDVDDAFPYWLYAGQQDNSTIAVPSAPPVRPPAGTEALWRSVGGCETGPAVPKPGDPTVVYANCKGRFSVYSAATGQDREYSVGATNIYGHNPADLRYRFQRVAPVEVSPHDPNVVYHGSQYVHRTTDGGRTWATISPDLTAFEPDKQVISGTPITRDITGEEYYSALYAIEESPVQRGIIWAGANDGPIHVTTDGGRTWRNVTPRNLPPGGRVQSIEPSPHAAGTAYVAVYRYLLDDWQPYVFRTTDFGATWTRLTTGANGVPPDVPTRVVRADPDREGLLYLGTEFGMYVSLDDGGTWHAFQQNLPATPVTDIRVHRRDLVLSTMGRSFWILDDVTPLHTMDANLRPTSHRLFPPRESYRTRSMADGTVTEAEPSYPRPGVVISYFVREPATDGLRVEILDAAGAVIRTYSADDASTVSDRTAQGSLEGGTGLHRFRWDLRHEAPAGAGDHRTTGPWAVPGTYRVRLTIGEWTDTQPFTLLPDPRLAGDGVSPEDLVAQYEISREVLQLLADARQLLAAVRDARKEAALGDTAAAALGAIEDRLATDRTHAYPEPQLVDQVEYLYGMLQGADQAPGQDMRERAAALRVALGELEQLFRTTVP